ncbi:MAG: hypothetical protein AB8H80_21830 [Planctomycetota bacterium]
MGLSILGALVVGPLLTFVSDGQPMRFGVAVPHRALVEGLSLKGRGVLQWRCLPVGGGRQTEDPERPVWIELAVLAPRGTVRVVLGGAPGSGSGPGSGARGVRGRDGRGSSMGHGHCPDGVCPDGLCPDGRGPAFVRTKTDRRVAHGHEHTVRWEWADGTIDERVRTTFTALATLDGESYGVGEARTSVTLGLRHRARVWLQASRSRSGGGGGGGGAGHGWGRRLGLLPPAAGRSATLVRVRRHLAEVVDALHEMPGMRGAGDYRRSGGEITNLEFDTTYGLLRCAIACRQPRAFALALRGAAHLVDRDIDVQTGLPCVHGETHRGVAPEPGHVWLQGLLWVGLVTADDEALQVAHSLGRALCARPPAGEGRNERLRDFAWPLLQLEALHRVSPQPRVALAADRLAVAIVQRFGAGATCRFGEGQREHGVYFERGWLVAGLLLPALRAHAARRPDEEVQRCVRRLEEWLSDRIGRASEGLPTHWRLAAAAAATGAKTSGRAAGRVFAVHREHGTARSTWLLEALRPRELRSLVARSPVRRGLDGVPLLDHPDLATEFSMIARCDWPWR